MKYTKNYHLPQWVEDDLILMDDFNKMNESIENGITEAKAVADTAQAKAEQLPYVVGQYQGNAQSEWNEVNVGFCPRFVLITAQTFAQEADTSLMRFALLSKANSGSFGMLTGSGFAVRMLFSYLLPQVNAEITYSYIAFR